MTSFRALRLRYLSWQYNAAKKRLIWLQRSEQDGHSLWAPCHNLYKEYDIGNKNIRYPDGCVKSIRVTKVKDTAGVTFYTFPSTTPLS